MKGPLRGGGPYNRDLGFMRHHMLVFDRHTYIITDSGVEGGTKFLQETIGVTEK